MFLPTYNKSCVIYVSADQSYIAAKYNQTVEFMLVCLYALYGSITQILSLINLFLMVCDWLGSAD